MYHDQIDFSIVLHGFFGFLKINIQLFTRIYLTEHESLSLATLHAEGAEGCGEDGDDEIVVRASNEKLALPEVGKKGDILVYPTVFNKNKQVTFYADSDFTVAE